MFGFLFLMIWRVLLFVVTHQVVCLFACFPQICRSEEREESISRTESLTSYTRWEKDLISWGFRYSTFSRDYLPFAEIWHLRLPGSPINDFDSVFSFWWGFLLFSFWMKRVLFYITERSQRGGIYSNEHIFHQKFLLFLLLLLRYNIHW